MKKQKDTVLDKAPPPLYPVKTKLQVTIILLIVLGFYVLSINWSQNQMIGGFSNTLSNMKLIIDKFFPPNMAIVLEVWEAIAQTIQMAIISTTIAASLTIPFALLSAKNIAPANFVYYITRTFLNILRTIPDLMLAVLFVSLFGVGMFSGILALTIFSLGILAKLISETIESIDMKPLEAAKGCGGGRIQVIVVALVPQILPQFMSFVLYVLEINIRASIILGLVGAGGIGLALSRELNFYNYPNAMGIIIIIFVIVISIEFISNKIREKLI